MSTSSSNLTHLKNLSQEITAEFNKITEKFSSFQNANGLYCPTGCGKCCFKPDIFCTPIELLPMALDLFERGEAERVYDLCTSHQEDRCMFMQIENRSSGKGRCREYVFRPLVCRIFGVAGRRDKNDEINFSICSTLREVHPEETTDLLNKKFEQLEVPLIELAKSNLGSLDPRFLEKEYPINVALGMMLEKILLQASYID